MVLGIDHDLKKRKIDATNASKVKIGGLTNHLEISKTTGTPRLRGTGTTWKDMIMSLFGAKLESEAGKVTYDYDENIIVFASGGLITNSADRVGGNQEINHEFKDGTMTFHPHIHWFQDAATKFEITLRYRVQNNGEAKVTDWTTIVLTANDTDDVYEYVSGTICQITKFPDIEIGFEISDTIQFQMARTDALGGTMDAYFFDLHGEVDSLGSEAEYAKEA